MKSLVPIRIMFLLAGLYDGLAGLAFLVAGPAIYRLAGIGAPNHWGYIHFPAGLMVVFGLMFLALARRPVENRNLVIYGILMKVSFVGTVVWHVLHAGIPAMWTYFAWADAAWGLLFVWAMLSLKAAAPSAT